jgi:Txe/YoeB family toxin of Txe-Axe toxin-antitoxin module
MKKVLVGFISEKLKKEFESLKSGRYEEGQLYVFIDRAIDDLKGNPACGTKVPKELWPKKYIKEYKITNLWKYDLPNAWRLVYTIEHDEVRIVSIILEWFDHAGYERRFGY